jgi:hypothetical protein
MMDPSNVGVRIRVLHGDWEGLSLQELKALRAGDELASVVKEGLVLEAEMQDNAAKKSEVRHEIDDKSLEDRVLLLAKYTLEKERISRKAPDARVKLSEVSARLGQLESLIKEAKIAASAGPSPSASLASAEKATPASRGLIGTILGISIGFGVGYGVGSLLAKCTTDDALGVEILFVYLPAVVVVAVITAKYTSGAIAGWTTVFLLAISLGLASTVGISELDIYSSGGVLVEPIRFTWLFPPMIAIPFAVLGAIIGYKQGKGE